MISTSLARLARQNSWQTLPEDDSVYGIYNGYRFTVMDGHGFKAIFTPLAGISPAGLQALLDWLAENSRQLKLRNYEASDNFLCIRLQEKWRTRTAGQLEWVLAQLSGMLSQYGLPENACAICGEIADRQGLLHGLFCALHPECQDRETVDFTTPEGSSEAAAEAEAAPAVPDAPTTTSGEAAPDAADHE
jgi:hypothetical protein